VEISILFVYFRTLPTKAGELHLIQRVTLKKSRAIIIVLRVFIMYGQQCARDQLVYYKCVHAVYNLIVNHTHDTCQVAT